MLTILRRHQRIVTRADICEHCARPSALLLVLDRMAHDLIVMVVMVIVLSRIATILGLFPDNLMLAGHIGTIHSIR